MISSPSITTPRLRVPLWRRRKFLTALVVGSGAATVLLPTRRAQAFLFDIVLDPVALVENVLKVVDMGQQLDAVAQQVENEVNQLKHSDISVAPDISSTVAGVDGKLDSSLYQTQSPANQLETRYPSDMSSTTWNQYQSDESTWADDQRQALVENRQVQNQVYGDMSATADQVKAIVDASNTASGETSAIQAHNDLLAVASGELAKLQTLKLTRSRLRTEQLAQQQSEASYAESERQRVRDGWSNPAPPTETVVEPFLN